MKESYLYQKLEGKKTHCLTCTHNCLILPGKRGICGVRENIDGKLYFLVYGKAVAEHLDPIEKKPFFHFLPGSHSLSIATIGCNLKCANCQNWEISQISKEPKINRQQIEEMGVNLPPQKIVEHTLKQNTPSISYTYTEPTIFLEYALDTMKLAKKKGLKNCWVTNGFMSRETLELIAPYLDAANVDLKSFDDEFYQKNCGAKLQPILDSLKLMKQLGIWVEVTTLVIPTLSDNIEMLKKIAKFIFNELGSQTPWHISCFSGAISWRLQKLPETPIVTLKNAYQIGRTAGLKYVYLGNLPAPIQNLSDLNYESTYCPRCYQLNIDRQGYNVIRFDNKGKCFKCGENLNIISV